MNHKDIGILYYIFGAIVGVIDTCFLVQVCMKLVQLQVLSLIDSIHQSLYAFEHYNKLPFWPQNVKLSYTICTDLSILEDMVQAWTMSNFN